jgi:hypothetical protein
MSRYLLIAAMTLALVACEQVKEMTGQGGSSSTPSSASSTPATTPASEQTRTVKSMDGSFDGEIVGPDPAPGSKFSKVKIGMRIKQVEQLIGQPNDTDSHLTGKAFIPFFFGGDTHRTEYFYAHEGILTFSPAHFAGEPDTLVRIIVDPTEQGFAH